MEEMVAHTILKLSPKIIRLLECLEEMGQDWIELGLFWGRLCIIVLGSMRLLRNI